MVDGLGGLSFVQHQGGCSSALATVDTARAEQTLDPHSGDYIADRKLVVKDGDGLVASALLDAGDHHYGTLLVGAWLHVNVGVHPCDKGREQFCLVDFERHAILLGRWSLLAYGRCPDSQMPKSWCPVGNREPHHGGSIHGHCQFDIDSVYSLGKGEGRRYGIDGQLISPQHILTSTLGQALFSFLMVAQGPVARERTSGTSDAGMLVRRAVFLSLQSLGVMRFTSLSKADGSDRWICRILVSPSGMLVGSEQYRLHEDMHQLNTVTDRFIEKGYRVISMRPHATIIGEF